MMTGDETPGEELAFAEELASARRQRDAAVARLRNLETSPSFRVGRAATWLPRAVKSLLRASSSRAKPPLDRKAAMSAARSTQPPLRFRSWTPMPRADKPDVTVVVPVYNSEAWLEDCLCSVLAQTGITIEVICVDDGSTDGSASSLQRFAEKDERVRIITQMNSGQSVGRNRGLNEAAGRYVIYLDSDDFWRDDLLSSLVQEMDSAQLDLLLFDSSAFRDGEVSPSIWDRYATYYQRSKEYRDPRSGVQMLADMRARRDYRPHVGLYLARTVFVRAVGTKFIPGIVHQDNPYTFSLLLHAERVAHVRTDFYARRLRPGSTITGLDDLRSAKGYYLSYLAMMRELGSRSMPPEISSMVADVVHGVFRGAQKKMAFLSVEDVASLTELDRGLDAQLVIRAIQSGGSRPHR